MLPWKDPAVSPLQLSCIFWMYLLLFCLFRKILKVVLFLWYFVELLRWKEFHLLQQMDQNWAWVANLSNSPISQVLRFLNWRGKLMGTCSTTTFNGCNFYGMKIGMAVWLDFSSSSDCDDPRLLWLFMITTIQDNPGIFSQPSDMPSSLIYH